MRTLALSLTIVVGGGLGLAACASTPPPHDPLAIEVSTQVDGDRHDLASRVWGLRPTDPMPPIDAAVAARVAPGPHEPQDPPANTATQPQGQGQPQGRGEKAPDQQPQDRATLRARFGSTILIGPDGRITKQYFLAGEAGEVLLNLLREPGAGSAKPQDLGPLRLGGKSGGPSILAQMLGEAEVEVFFFHRFEVPEGVNLRTKPNAPLQGTPPKPTDGAPNSLLLVTALPDALATFEGALDLFFANIPQVEIEIKVVEYTTSDAIGFGVQPIDTLPTLDNTSSRKLVKDITAQFPLTFPVVGSASLTDRGLITLGGIHDSWVLNAKLEALESSGIADIISSPKLVVRNGGVASIITKTDFPYPKASISASGQNVTTDIQFRPVGITMNIRPRIAGTETVILEILANISAVTSFADTDPVDTPIVSNREVVTSVHVSDGRTTVIGGLVSNSTFDQTSQVPILGDIPILGYLFRTTSTTTQKTTLEFHITPRIIQGSGGYLGS